MNNKITIVSGTNRRNSLSAIVSNIYADVLKSFGIHANIIDLRDLPENFIHTSLYDKAGKNDEFNVSRKEMADTDKFVFIVPEYNGSFPGVLKTFIDGLIFPDTFKNKKCALVGISSGIQGGILAISHLTDIFNYCGMHVLALKLKFSHINKHVQGKEITNALYMDLIREQAEELINF